MWEKPDRFRQASHVFTHRDLEKVRGDTNPEGTTRERIELVGWYENGRDE